MEPSSSPAAPDGSALCTKCGLCCDGLFARVRLAADDLPLARRSAGGIVERDGRSHAVLPCSFLRDRVCTVYAERYAACRTFTCKLLRGYASGEVDAATAHARVVAMRGRLDQVRAAAAGRSMSDFYDDVATWFDLADREQRQAKAKLQLAVVACNLYADKHFRNVADPRALA